MNFAGILGFEIAFFQIHDDVAAEVQMVEEEVDEKLALADGERALASDEGKAAPEFDEEFLDVGYEASLQLALQEGFGEGEEVEEVGVFQ